MEPELHPSSLEGPAGSFRFPSTITKNQWSAASVVRSSEIITMLITAKYSLVAGTGNSRTAGHRVRGKYSSFKPKGKTKWEQYNGGGKINVQREMWGGPRECCGF